MSHISKLVIFALSAVAVSGCGTILTPSQALVTFTSDPPGAEVMVDGLPVGQTPVQTWVDNRRDHLVTVHDETGQQVTCLMRSTLGAGWLVLDILLGLVPVIVDAATAGWNELDQLGCHAIFRDATAPDGVPVPVASTP